MTEADACCRLSVRKHTRRRPAAGARPFAFAPPRLRHLPEAVDDRAVGCTRPGLKERPLVRVKDLTHGGRPSTRTRPGSGRSAPRTRNSPSEPDNTSTAVTVAIPGTMLAPRGRLGECPRARMGGRAGCHAGPHRPLLRRLSRVRPEPLGVLAYLTSVPGCLPDALAPNPRSEDTSPAGRSPDYRSPY